MSFESSPGPPIASSEALKNGLSGKRRLRDDSSTLEAGMTKRFTTTAKVTSMDMTPDGSYVITGCSDGSIRLYSTSSEEDWGVEGLLLGQILAKGLITSLIFHVEVTEDGRFAFAGVLRGANEMYAYDLSRLPRSREQQRRLSKEKAESLIEMYMSSDPKLRGFGAAAVVQEGEHYRLFCGLGIKNLHVWAFKPTPPKDAGEEAGPHDVWGCICDRASNGMSIELLAARRGGRQAVSKSNGQNLRVWELPVDAQAEAAVTYRDVSNTQDMRAVFGDWGYGGTCQLALVCLDEALAPLANRMELALPTSSTAQQQQSSSVSGRSWGSGLGGKRRQLCTVKDVVGTHDGSHVLVICSDGGVYDYTGAAASRTSNGEAEGQEGSGSVAGELVPYPRLSAAMGEGEDEGANYLTVAKVGGNTVMVLRSRGSEIVIEPLGSPAGATGDASTRSSTSRPALGELDRNVETSGQQGAAAPAGGARRASSEGAGKRRDEGPEVAKPKKRSRGPQVQQQDGSSGLAQGDERRAAPAPEGARVLCSAKPPPKPRPSAQSKASPALLALQQQSALAQPRRHFDPFAAARSRQNRRSEGDWRTGRPVRDAQAKKAAEDAHEKAQGFFRRHLDEYEVIRMQQPTPPPTIPPPPIVAPIQPEPVHKTWGDVRAVHQKEREKLLRQFRAEHDLLHKRFVEAMERHHAEHGMGRWCTAAGVSSIDAQPAVPCNQPQGAAARRLIYRKGRQAQMDDASLASIVANYQDLKSRMLRRQQGEADTLSAMQGMDLPLLGPKPSAPRLQVLYPYEQEWVSLSGVGTSLGQVLD